MWTSDFDFFLPLELIAQKPAARRDASRLLVLNRATQSIEHRMFSDLPGILRPDDLLVLNNSKVLRARLRAQKSATGGRFELLLLEEIVTNEWWCLLRPAKRAAIDSRLGLIDPEGRQTSIGVKILGKLADGTRRVRFEGTPDIRDELDRLGEVPLPPYIERMGAPSAEDAERYQTIYAGPPGSVAAPTAGLHFTRELLEALKERGVETTEVTLHVGLGTFAPVKELDLSQHQMHEEKFFVPEGALEAVTRAKREKRRIVAVGTTAVRVLESAAGSDNEPIQPGEGRTRIFIHPPHNFRVVDALITNFHLPRSTLLMLASAFACPGGTGGRDLVMKAYSEVIRERYRFFSYGDAMFIQ